MRLSRDLLWGAIYEFAKACGGDVGNYNTTHDRVRAEKSIDGVLDSYQGEFDALTERVGGLAIRVKEKEKSLEAIREASFLLKNTAKGNVLLLPGNLEVLVTEAMNK